MGRGKERRKSKQKHLSAKRRKIRLKMGKPVFFNLCWTPKPIKGFSHRYNYKANLYKVLYSNSEFYNVRWSSSNITYCSFRNAHCVGVDFVNTNLKNTSFVGTIFENVVFFNCNLKNTNFKGAKFKNVVFISTNLNNTKNLSIDDNCKIYKSYPKLDIDKDIESSLKLLYKLPQIRKYNVLFVNSDKLNLWILRLLLDSYGKDVFRALLALNGERHIDKFFTVYFFKKYIEKYLNV